MPEKKKQSMWELLRERLSSIGEMANAMKRKKKAPEGPPKIRTRRTPPRPQPSPEQEEYLKRQRAKPKE